MEVVSNAMNLNKFIKIKASPRNPEQINDNKINPLKSSDQYQEIQNNA